MPKCKKMEVDLCIDDDHQTFDADMARTLGIDKQVNCIFFPDMARCIDLCPDLFIHNLINYLFQIRVHTLLYYKIISSISDFEFT